MKRLCAIAGLALLATLFSLPVFAQAAAVAAPSTTVNFTGIFDSYVVPIFETAVTGGVLFLIKHAHGFITKWIGDSQAAQLETSITHGIQWAMDQLAEQVDQRDILDIDVKNATVAGALSYVTKFNPALLSVFGLDASQEALKTRIQAQLATMLGVDYHIQNGKLPLPPNQPATVQPPVAQGVVAPAA